jgi:hypothetical protein
LKNNENAQSQKTKFEKDRFGGETILTARPDIKRDFTF